MANYIETELGIEKECIHCGDYFPATKEFFYGTSYKKDGTPCLEANCKACYKERFKPWIQRCYDVAHRYEVRDGYSKKYCRSEFHHR